ncbi:glycosyltransferase, group 2 family protein [Bordetella bronchiseptica SBL-F6116]|nr:glycosyltransferase, group 2 family protein [Bordetella bronchiseptica SBL-F6116]
MPGVGGLRRRVHRGRFGQHRQHRRAGARFRRARRGHAGLAGIRTAEEPRPGPGHGRLGAVHRCRRARHARAGERDPAAMAGATADCYEIARLSDFCGRFIRHSGWWPDYVLRLFRRGSARFTDAAVHERVVPAQGQPARLRGHFLHYPYNNFDALIAKVNRYSSDAAAMMHARGKRATVFSALGHGFWTFVRIYLIRRGFLDGRHGLVLAVTAAAGSFFRYAKLMFLSEPRK